MARVPSSRSPSTPHPALLLAELLAFFFAYELLLRALRSLAPLSRSLLRPDAWIFRRTETPAWLLATGAALFVLFPALRVIRRRWRPTDFGLPRAGWGAAALSAVTFFCLAFAVSTAGYLLFPDLPAQVYGAYGLADRADFLAFLLFTVPLSAAVYEEVAFRSFLQGSLAEWDPRAGPFVAAMAFALGHAFQGLLPLLAFHVPGALVLAAHYSRHRNLVVLVAVHLAFDLAAFTVLYAIAAEGLPRVPIAGACLAASVVGVVLTRRAGGALLREAWAILGALRRRPVSALAWTAVFALAFLLLQEVVTSPWLGTPRLSTSGLIGSLAVALAIYAAAVVAERTGGPGRQGRAGV